MKPSLRMGIVAVALMSSVGVAVAAEPAHSSSSLPNASMSPAKDNLNLTSVQERSIWQDVSQQNSQEKTPAGFTAKVGDKVPSAVKITPLPTTVTNDIVAVRPYEYAMLDNKQLLIVNPVDKKIVDIITHSGASG